MYNLYQRISTTPPLNTGETRIMLQTEQALIPRDLGFHIPPKPTRVSGSFILIKYLPIQGFVYVSVLPRAKLIESLYCAQKWACS